jgi:hypothetical protein
LLCHANCQVKSCHVCLAPARGRSDKSWGEDHYRPGPDRQEMVILGMHPLCPCLGKFKYAMGRRSRYSTVQYSCRCGTELCVCCTVPVPAEWEAHDAAVTVPTHNPFPSHAGLEGRPAPGWNNGDGNLCPELLPFSTHSMAHHTSLSSCYLTNYYGTTTVVVKFVFRSSQQPGSSFEDWSQRSQRSQ